MAEGGAINIAVLGSAAVGILVLAVIIMLGPTIPIRVPRSVGVNGGSMEQAMPALGATSEWNSSYNTDIPTGANWSLCPIDITELKRVGADNSVPPRDGNRDPRSHHHLRNPGCSIGILESPFYHLCQHTWLRNDWIDQTGIGRGMGDANSPTPAGTGVKTAPQPIASTTSTSTHTIGVSA